MYDCVNYNFEIYVRDILLDFFFFFGKILKKKIKVKGNNIFIF